METINNVATAAAKAVWGGDDTNREPISGATGDVSKGQPYDAGNLEAEDQKKVERNLSGDKKPETTGGPADESAPSKPSAVEATPAHGDTSHQQTDVRHPENPDEPEIVEPKGPGPKPVAIVAAEHGGDAGKRDVSAEDESSKPDDEGPSKENKGTGEQVVTASGFAAEGGDFDATKPGAAKEADRLLDQKGEGVSHSHGDSTKDTDDNGSSKDKKRLGERIKAKFHKH